MYCVYIAEKTLNIQTMYYEYKNRTERMRIYELFSVEKDQKTIKTAVYTPKKTQKMYQKCR